jgi:hypothetical protein
MKKAIPAAVFVSFIMLLAQAAAVGRASADLGAIALGTHVQKFIVHDGTMLDGIARLSSERSEISFAFEEVLKARFNDPDPPQLRFDLSLEDQTVSQILDALCGRDARYTWVRDGLTVNVYPQSTVNDSSYLPNRQFAQAGLLQVKNAEQAVFALVAQIPPPFEQIAVMQVGGDTSYATAWTTTFRNMTVRQAFNLIARHLGPTGGWSLGGSREFRTIGFHTGTIHYKSENERTR